MTTVLAIIIYNRYDNLKRWLKCWEQSDKGAELVVIHTGDEDWSEDCKGVTYIKRKNEGFDIGAMQDVFMNRLPGFPYYDRLLWVCDDTFPMSKDFVKQFDAAMVAGVGVACMQISKSVAPHVRTTGFMIDRKTAERIQFTKDIKTKEDCYFFEHRGRKLTLTEQVRAMGLSCVMVSDVKTSPMWDSFHPNVRLRVNRLQEFNRLWGFDNQDKVTFICTIYNTYPQIISSLLLQTHKNWELILIHDGPSSNGMLTYIPKDPRIKYIETKTRLEKWGHPLRQMALRDYELADFTVVTNADNYYAPVFIEYMLKGFNKSPNAVAIYCSDMIHSYKAWQVIPCRLEQGFLDCGGVMVKSNAAKQIGWRDTESHSADWTYFSDIISKYSPSNFVSVKGCLFCHN